MARNDKWRGNDGILQRILAKFADRRMHDRLRRCRLVLLVWRLGRITPSGSVRFYALPAAANIAGMTLGPDGAVWFTDTGTHALGRITTAGTLTEYPTTLLPSFTSGGIATGSDGALWFTSYVGISTPPYSAHDLIGRYSPATGFTSFAVTPGSAPSGIAAGSDGALWFTEAGASNIGRITPAGVLTEFPNDELPGSHSSGITRSGNALWFVTGGLNRAVGEITTAEPSPSRPCPHNICSRAASRRRRTVRCGYAPLPASCISRRSGERYTRSSQRMKLRPAMRLSSRTVSDASSDPRSKPTR